MLGHLQEILAHINRVRTSSIPRKTEICRYLFDALNKTWTAFNYFEKELERADSPSLYRLILSGMPAYSQEFLQSRELESLAELEPHIMNHQTLRRGGYRPNQEIEARLRKEATREHREFVNAYRRYKASPSSGTSERLAKKSAQLLYVVRSNIAHGEKTPYGPDLVKLERDEKVSETVIPVLVKLLDLIFDKPDQKLVVYGTLAPGAANESLLKGIDGLWQECRIRGDIRICKGLKYFKWDPAAGETIVQMITSEHIPSKLPNLDRFEGDGYHRILIPVKIADRFVVANVYEGTDI
jgi:gamma-glutamylcyclotransferase (GGCT)/AIG2-like uncharacterized protein YtfP